nr:hypothetical protein [Lysobacter enzymogenes]
MGEGEDLGARGAVERGRRIDRPRPGGAVGGGDLGRTGGVGRDQRQQRAHSAANAGARSAAARRRRAGDGEWLWS